MELFGAKYGVAPPDVARRDVVLVDFCYTGDALQLLKDTAKSILVLDHHKTAEEALAGVPSVTLAQWQRGVKTPMEYDQPWFGAIFDMERSGAGIAWDFFHPTQSRPHLINYIEDRDLWRFALPASREVHAGLATYPFDFATYDELMGGGLSTVQSLAKMGEVLERKQKQDLATLLPISTRTMRIGGYDVPVANMPITMCSDAGNMLSEGKPFAATYFDGPEGRNFSLRSQQDGLDVSEIAKLYGGGGHAHASGFKRPIGWEGDLHLSDAKPWP